MEIAKPASPAANTKVSSAASSGGSVTSLPSAPQKAVASKVGAGPKSPVVVAALPLEDHVTYQYNALGRRDPFQPLFGGEFVGADVGGDAPPDVGGIKVVGIVWGGNDQFALVEDAARQQLVLASRRQGHERLRRDAQARRVIVEHHRRTGSPSRWRFR